MFRYHSRPVPRAAELMPAPRSISISIYIEEGECGKRSTAVADDSAKAASEDLMEIMFVVPGYAAMNFLHRPRYKSNDN